MHNMEIRISKGSQYNNLFLEYSSTSQQNNVGCLLRYHLNLKG